MPRSHDVDDLFGTHTLLLAFYLFARDRRRDDREQIDKVGVWALWETADSEPMPFIPHLIEIPEGVFFSLIARNANDVPVTVHLINFVVRPRWAVPTSAYDAYVSRDVQEVREVVDGMENVQLSSLKALIPPGETLTIGRWHLNLAMGAPNLATVHDAIYSIERFLAVDNAGRRWIVRPGQGKRARQIRWYSRRKRDFPREWKRPAVLWLTFRMFRCRDALRESWRAWCARHADKG